MGDSTKHSHAYYRAISQSHDLESARPMSCPELFPTSSNALKVGLREPMIHAEVLSHEADILCLQEVDRLERLLPVLETAGYDHTYAAGLGKKHGCLIAYRKDKYSKVGEKVVQYDLQEVREDGSENARIGSSHTTRNIGSLVALARLDAEGDGLVVATTHLFWHPAYAYERARQAGILMKETLRFQEAMHRKGWPCIIAGDFNFAPNDPAYSLLVGDILSPEQCRALELSRVVHVSVDPSVPIGHNGAVDDESNGTEADPDRVINNARPATPSDGLLSDLEMVDLFSGMARLRSAYDEGQRRGREIGALNGAIETFGDRLSVLPVKPGAHEPMFTSYTHHWKTTLDYIFVLDAPSGQFHVTGYASPHRTEDVKAGLPQAGICGSDHFSLCAELHFVPLDRIM
ncbi:endonuclease exonuclease phosphatase [Leucogyrophana mollusca]|uniref:Endonuclease exonuclease phosphatase n=1 Tax=Leucogyrophana mollusca TaxID=85980 RepID=A0ACB8BZU4_9AGAM|nr:endonuclease exonuclease phosphatase [Leucogyrophana mollusca]